MKGLVNGVLLMLLALSLSLLGGWVWLVIRELSVAAALAPFLLFAVIVGLCAGLDRINGYPRD